MAVYNLHKRGSEEVFGQAEKWCVSANAVERELAVDILAQLGGPVLVQDDPVFAPRSIELARRLLSDDDSDVQASAVIALARLDASDEVVDSPSLAEHESIRVRHAVAYALGFSESSHAAGILMRLMHDLDDEVRNWATFGLGVLRQDDSPEIRQTLLTRLKDPHDETRGEAMVGLALRKEIRVIPHIRAELISDDVMMLAVEAARDIGSPALLRALVELRSWWDLDSSLLEEAIGACRGEEVPD